MLSLESGTWPRSHVAPIGVPLYNPLVMTAFQVRPRGGCLHVQAHAFHRFGMGRHMRFQVVRASRGATMAGNWLRCVLVALLLIAQKAAEKNICWAFTKAPFINLEMNETGIGCWGGHFQI